jgi:hypothetical protein
MRDTYPNSVSFHNLFSLWAAKGSILFAGGRAGEEGKLREERGDTERTGKQGEGGRITRGGERQF